MTITDEPGSAEIVENPIERKVLPLARSLILATGAVSAVILNALAGAGDHPHLAALLIRWFAALPFLAFGFFYAGLIYFRQYKLPAVVTHDGRPRWLVAVADYLISKTPQKAKRVLQWTAETYILVLMFAVVGFCLLLGGILLLKGAVLFIEVNSLLYQNQLKLLS
jgi:hypothetical protein